MLMTILNVVYVLVAIAMIALILMQRGAGAQAGSGFGGGASATVFGSRGASNFLSKSTKWLAIAFFAISLFMAWYATHSSTRLQQTDLGVMGAASSVPQAPAGSDKGGTVPSAPGGGTRQPASGGSVPQAPAQNPQQQQPQQAPAQPQPSPQGG